MIVKNEEQKLFRCLNSAKTLVDEIIIVDTGSTDNTKRIARKFTDDIYDFKWVNSFCAARNFSFSKATCDYILWLDADDILLPHDAAEFSRLKEVLCCDADIIMMKYNTAFKVTGEVSFSCMRERLIKRSKGLKWLEPVHEYVEIKGKVIESEVAITHTQTSRKPSSRNLKIYESIISKNEKLSPRGNYYYARELMDNGHYLDAIKQFKFFLESNQGWVEDNINACFELSRLSKIVNNQNDVLTWLLKSFNYAPPRPEICCHLGYYFKEKQSINQAIFWFERALSAKAGNWSFRQSDYQNYIPCIELASCYQSIGNNKKSQDYLIKAKK